MSNEDLRLSDKRKATQTFLRERKLCFPADLGLFSIQFWCQMKDWGVPEFTLKKKGGLGCRISQCPDNVRIIRILGKCPCTYKRKQDWGCDSQISNLADNLVSCIPGKHKI